MYQVQWRVKFDSTVPCTRSDSELNSTALSHVPRPMLTLNIHLTFHRFMLVFPKLLLSFESWRTETFWKIILNQTIRIRNNNLNRKVLKKPKNASTLGSQRGLTIPEATQRGSRDLLTKHIFRYLNAHWANDELCFKWFSNERTITNILQLKIIKYFTL